ncbi:hypothetical protein GGR56DRAFT_641403 [Xylariaceae sp. FL0804]|nr:hypothetical protein GGR56DRAFT_641403 [Xylariaceae sp. FL0804]
MELTPIKVRGKRRLGGKGEGLFEAPRLKRPRRDIRPRRKKSKPPTASFIEREIPLEVLERIFWLSENVNFPRSNPRVGRLLSGASTLRETFIQAFGPTWDVWYGCMRSSNETNRTVQSYAGWEDDSARFGGNPEFQSALLEYSWTTVPFILDCWEIWVRRHAKHRPFERVTLWGASITTDDGSAPENIDHVVDTGEFRREFLQDYQSFRQLGRQTMSELSTTSQGEPISVFRIEVHRDTRIPDDLLTGPWDEAALQKFFWLVRAGARLSQAQTWEVTLQGYRNAIAGVDTLSDDVNLTVVRLLDSLGAFEAWPGFIVTEEYEKFKSIQRSAASQIPSSIHHKHAYVMALLSELIGQ